MQSQRKYSTVLLMVTFLLSACAGNAQTEDSNALMTSAVGTMVAGFFETQTAMVTPPTVAPTATETKFPTPTQFISQGLLSSPTPTFLFYTATLGTPLSPTVTGTLPTATVNSSALAYGCSNLAFVRDVNYPNGTVVKPGQEFTKTWKVENNGTCDWLFAYRLVFLSGTNVDPVFRTLGRLVVPGSWAEVSAVISAPAQPGTYSSYFRFSDGSHPFGATLGVTFKVDGNPTKTVAPVNTSTPTLTNVPATATPTLTLIPTETPTETSIP